jgi:hypothetical protein
VSVWAVNVVIQSSELARFCVGGSGLVTFAIVISKPIVLYLCEYDDLDYWGGMRCRKDGIMGLMLSKVLVLCKGKCWS